MPIAWRLKTLKVILIVLLFLIFLMSSVRLVTTQTYMMLNYNKYERHHELYFDYEYANQNVVDYLNNKQDTLDFPISKDNTTPLMTERGQIHMGDVKVLYNYGRIILWISIVTAITISWYLYKNKELINALRKVWLAPIVFALILSLGMFIDFDSAFTLFHELLFNNDLWLLDWYDPLLIMYPEQFFMNTAFTILGITIVCSILTSLISIYIGGKTNERRNYSS